MIRLCYHHVRRCMRRLHHTGMDTPKLYAEAAEQMNMHTHKFMLDHAEDRLMALYEFR